MNSLMRARTESPQTADRQIVRESRRLSHLALGAVLLMIGGTCPLSHATCDTAPPSVTSFSLNPTSVNVSAAPQNVTCTMGLSDSISGVASTTCTLQFQDAINLVFQSASCSSTTPSSGTPQNGTYSCVITIPRYSAQGVWSATVTASDAVGNSKTYQNFELPPPATVNVTSDQDIIAPAMSSATLNPTSVNVSSGAQNVTCSMNVTDAKSGVGSAFCLVEAPTTSSQQSQGCSSSAPSSGTRNNGTFQCTISMPRYSDAGTWTTLVSLRDQVGNSSNPATSATLAVTASPEDIVAPTLTSFDFNPKTVDTGSSSATTTCTMNISDATSGVSSATCDFSISDFTTFPPVQETQGCTSTTPSSGTRNSGTFSCVVTLPKFSAGGSWFPAVSLIDAVGNTTSANPATPLTVNCGGGSGDPECTINFLSDKKTLNWNAIAGATQYNIYRGLVTGLTDNNHDGQPDNGFGTCQNSRDPNLTDTQFVDSDVPTQSQKGFHYLVAYKSGGVEKGLGKTSSGANRIASSPCP